MQSDYDSSMPEPEKSAITIQEFTELYDRYGDAVFANILKILKNFDDSEDILQKVFMSLWENRHRLHGRSITGWLFVVSKNMAISHLNQLAKFSFDPLDAASNFPDYSEGSMEREILFKDQWNMILEAFEALPKRKKMAFQLFRFNGKSKEEVAEDMEISINTVSDYLKRSNQMIRAYIKMHYSHSLDTE